MFHIVYGKKIPFSIFTPPATLQKLDPPLFPTSNVVPPHFSGIPKITVMLNVIMLNDQAILLAYNTLKEKIRSFQAGVGTITSNTLFY